MEIVKELIESMGGIPNVNDLLKFIVTALKENQFAQGGFIIGLLSAAFMLLRRWLIIPWNIGKKWFTRLFVEHYVSKQEETELSSSYGIIQSHLNDHVWWNNVKYESSYVDGLPEGSYIGRSPEIGFFSVTLRREATEKLVRYSLTVTGLKGINARIRTFVEGIKEENRGDYVHLVNGDNHLTIERKRIPFIPSLCHVPTLRTVSQKVKYLIDNREKIEEKGFPARLGICLYGPPGTGKSSFLNGILKESDIDQVMHVTNDTTMRQINHFITNPSTKVLVFDDVDLLIEDGREVENKRKGGLPLRDVMNVMSSPFTTGAIFLFTTNYLDRLDSALIRKGRIDLLLEVPPMSDEQFTAVQKDNPLAELKREMSLSEMSEALLEVEMNSHEGDSHA